MKYIYLSLNWVFGILFGLTGLLSVLESPIAGLCLITISLLLLPPVRNLVYSKTKKDLSFKGRAIWILVLVVAFVIFVGQSQDKKAAKLAAQKSEEQAQKAANARQKNIDYFNSHREEIISSASVAIAEKNYQSVLSQFGKYLPTNDTELNDIYANAKNVLDERKKAEKVAREKAQREAKTKEILAKLKTVPVSETKENKELYQQLVKINPDNKVYKGKFDRYSHKLTEKLEKEIKEQKKLQKKRGIRIAKFGKAPSKSAWDGSYYAVERYLKKIANDPDSIEMDGCTKVYHIESGWLVGCDYRGRNAFGGMIRQSNWFTIVHEQVIQMHEASAYRP